MWCVLSGGGGEDVIIPIEVYIIYIREPPIQKSGDKTDLWAGTTEERPRGHGWSTIVRREEVKATYFPGSKSYEQCGTLELKGNVIVEHSHSLSDSVLC